MGSPLTVTNAPVNDPNTEALLARMISAVSGFFFWGIMEEVEQNASSRLTNLTNDEDQMTSSSQSRLAFAIMIDRSARVSRAKSRVATASMVLVTRPSNPRIDAVYSR